MIWLALRLFSLAEWLEARASAIHGRALRKLSGEELRAAARRLR